jgi:hypothetical protein
MSWHVLTFPCHEVYGQKDGIRLHTEPLIMRKRCPIRDEGPGLTVMRVAMLRILFANLISSQKAGNNRRQLTTLVHHY